MKKSVKMLSLLAGIVFLVSGIGKAIAAYEFSQLLSQYGFDFLRFLAPLIILLEVAAGLLLFFHIRLRQTSLFSFCFVAILSLAFLYGHFFANITDCGCFGYFSFLNTSLLFTSIRNFVLLSIFLYIFLNSRHSSGTMEKSEMALATLILCAVCFTTGYTYVERNTPFTLYTTEGKEVNKAVKDSALGDFVTLSPDSTYLVFAFSYSCPHCYNSIENLKQYERMGVVDRVIALSFTADSATIKKFGKIFLPNFPIKNYPPKQLFRLTNQFPVSYYIENSTIRMKIEGVLPCGYILQQYLQKVTGTRSLSP